jgi:hypothetical protein
MRLGRLGLANMQSSSQGVMFMADCQEPCLLAYSGFFNGVALLGISASVMTGHCDWSDRGALQ